MQRYFMEKAFLLKVEESNNKQNDRILFDDNQISELKFQYPGIPEDYLDYLKEIGEGSFRECQFSVRGWLARIKSIFGDEYAISDKNLLFFGDNFSGDLAGFDIDNNWELIEFWHDCREIYYLKRLFTNTLENKC